MTAVIKALNKLEINSSMPFSCIALWTFFNLALYSSLLKFI
jgi:hypothetical protein